VLATDALLPLGPRSSGPPFSGLRFCASSFCEMLFSGSRCRQLLRDRWSYAILQVFSADGSWAWVTVRSVVDSMALT
jgi:hypothetical protein